MRADHHALAALYAEVRLPNGNVLRDVALLPLRCADRVSSVQRKRAHGKQVAATRDNLSRHVLHKGWCFPWYGRRHVKLACWLCWNLNLIEVRERCINCREVLFDDRLPAFAVSFL